jgi:3',5'-cyclic AMP phosphodiesterase CpdA
MKIAWASDLHWDRANEENRERFLSEFRECGADAAVITGDIATSHDLTDVLGLLARTFQPRPIYFTLGNHDYFGSWIRSVDRRVIEMCRDTNLYPLGYDEKPIRLASDCALIGHHGWGDGMADFGRWYLPPIRDFDAIGDFRKKPLRKKFDLIKHLGEESARYFTRSLRQALRSCSRVFVATHVPPFTNALRSRRPDRNGDLRPHFCNFAAGRAINSLAYAHPNKRIWVLAGHTHTPFSDIMISKLRIETAQVTIGSPSIQRIVDLNEKW